ncbi:MAG: prepilin-type N-terminal cleavage/methylation domain-containing protein [Candidatus Zambryskibacteria bacterium]|nr:prepilin-type N-terminal cleavage/methylation domain-containing protein [Candidatus Zambryskibacteria bacterium]
MLHYFRNNRGLPRALSRGFTILELLVSIGIVAVILTVVVSNQSTYTENAALSNLADEISLTISQAQAYGIGVKEFSPGTSEFSASYGLAFSLLGSGSSGAYLTFADRNGNGIYDGSWACPVGGSSECIEKVNISRGNYINSLCIVRSSGGDLCNVGRIDVSFVRPDTKARLVFFDTGGGSINPSGAIGAKIVLKSPGGASSKSVNVYNTGQVSVTSTYYPYPYPTPYVYPTPYPYPTPIPYSYPTPIASGCSGGVDIGLRIYQDGAVRRVAVEPGSPTSYLRIYKNAIRGVMLTNSSDPNASKMRIQTPAGIKSLCLLP